MFISVCVIVYYISVFLLSFDSVMIVITIIIVISMNLLIIKT